MGEWKYRIMAKSEKLVDPIQSQFFTTNIVGGLTAALVRESIQNSLDASLKLPPKKDENGNIILQPVKVRFFLSGSKHAIPFSTFSNYSFGLNSHLTSSGNGLSSDELPDFSKDVPVLIVEDFNTRGLEGDPLESEDPPQNSSKKHNFYWFWRNVGRSGKGNEDRGRWGLGKTVFPAASKINTFFGITVREEDDRKLLMGQSVLKIHKLEIEENRFCPYGDYGNFVDKDDPDFVSPIEDLDKLNEFSESFMLKRDIENKDGKHSGLSLVIPYPDKQINRSELIKAAVVQYFHPIIAGNLEIYVEDENTEEPIVVNGENIENVLSDISFSEEEKFSKERLKSLFKFSKYAINAKEEDYINLRVPNIKRTPIWKKDWYIDEEIETQINDKIEPFDKGERVAFKVPVKTQKIGQRPQISWFKVYLENDESLKEADCHFVRDGITILEVNIFKRKNVRALVIIDEKELANLLGDAENPAHTEWQKDSPHFRGKYMNGDKVISFVVRSIENLYYLLLKPAKGIDEEIMKNVFYIELDGSQDPGSNQKGGKDPNKNKIPKNKNKPVLSVKKMDGGIIIEPDPKAEKTPNSVELKLAYLVAKGHPLKKYNSLDFDISAHPIEIINEGVEIKNSEANELKFKIEKENFSVKLLGFDKERDLFVQTNYYYDSEI